MGIRFELSTVRSRSEVSFLNLYQFLQDRDKYLIWRVDMDSIFHKYKKIRCEKDTNTDSQDRFKS